MRVLALVCLSLVASLVRAADIPLEKLKLPPGFHVEIFAQGVENARSMALGEKGTLFVGSMGAGNVYAIRHDGQKATDVRKIASGLNMPNGVAVKDGSLYVMEVNRLTRFDAIESATDKPKGEIVFDKYPSDRAHGWKFIRFGPDGRL